MALACRVKSRGHHVISTVRNAAEVSLLTPEQQQSIVEMDVSDTDSVSRAFERIDSDLEGRTLDAIVHCAGVARPGAVELTSIEEFAAILNTNSLGSLRVMQQAIPRLRGHGGRLVLLTSLWGRASGAMLAAYCASKHAVEAIADSARRETANMNMHIVIAEPGVVRTSMAAGQVSAMDRLIDDLSPAQDIHYGRLYRRYRSLVESAPALSADECAAQIEKILTVKRPATRYRIGTDSKLVCTLNWLLPDRAMDAMMAFSLNNNP